MKNIQRSLDLMEAAPLAAGFGDSSGVPRLNRCESSRVICMVRQSLSDIITVMAGCGSSMSSGAVVVADIKRNRDVDRLRRAGAPCEVAMRLVNHASELIHQIYQREKVEDVAQ